MLHGEFGESYKTPGLTANQIIEERFPASARLGLQAVVLGLVLGLILGIIAALQRNSWIDFLTIFIAIVGVSVPSFVFAALLQGLGGTVFPIVGWAKQGMGFLTACATPSFRRLQLPLEALQRTQGLCVPRFWM